MPSPQNVYTALSIISLGGLIGMGVAVGSGVSMMAMASYLCLRGDLRPPTLVHYIIMFGAAFGSTHLSVRPQNMIVH